MRRLNNWLSHYIEYAQDNYCPDSFHLWTGLTVLAAALERKVWLVNGKVTFYPNIYTVLVTHPGVGKSTALERGTDFIEQLKQEINPDIKIVPEQLTEPGLVKMMEERQELEVVGTKIVYHSSGFFYASEASASALQNTHGAFTSTLNRLYDCPKVFRKATAGSLKGVNGEHPSEIYNVCFSLLAGATFEYLRTLVNTASAAGGFASRIIYVIAKDRPIRTPKWGEAGLVDGKLHGDLFHDLAIIHKLKGRFRPTKEFIDAWEAFQPESDRSLAKLNSHNLESLAARISTNTTKVAMLLSIAESSDLVLDVHHWDKARELIDDVSKDNPFILSQAAIADKNSQLGVTQFLGQSLKRCGGVLPYGSWKSMALANGNPVDSITKTIDYMLASGWISLEGNNVKLLVDPDRYL